MRSAVFVALRDLKNEEIYSLLPQSVSENAGMVCGLRRRLCFCPIPVFLPVIAANIGTYMSVCALFVRYTSVDRTTEENRWK